MGIPVNGIFMVMPFFFKEIQWRISCTTCMDMFCGVVYISYIFLWISMNINSGILLYVVTVISVVELCVFLRFSQVIEILKERKTYIQKVVMSQLAIYIMGAVIADIAGKHNFAVCIFLGIIITSVMQLPCCIKLVIYNGGIFYED